MILADYQFYKESYFGDIIPESDYNRLATRAASLLDYYTMGKASTHADMEAVKMASCAVAERYLSVDKAQQASAEHGDLVSESVGGYSRSYRSYADSSRDGSAAIYAAIKQYLAGTGLLYGGVPVCIRRTL